MNKAIKAIATLMIVILIVVLIGIFLSYYSGNGIINTFMLESGNTNISTSNIPSGDYMSNNERDNIKNNEGLIDSIIKDSTENKENPGDNQMQGSTGSNDESKNSGDVDNSGDTFPNTVIEIPNDVREEPSQFVISSNSQTSNQEKQEVLDEIDKALQGLLEAVGKVEIVDETRLEATLNSEVDKP